MGGSYKWILFNFFFFNLYFNALVIQMDKVEGTNKNDSDSVFELLPGIENFLCDVLAKEKLSHDAKEQCKYYVERLEILKLPPTIPPRPRHEEVPGSQPEQAVTPNITAPAVTSKGEKLRLNAKKYNSAPVQGHETEVAAQTSDFAAFQRELARSLANPDTLDNEDSDPEEVKVYDDIDNSTQGDDVEDADCEEADLYEIPVTQTSEESPQSVEPIIRVIHCGNADDASSEEASSPQPRKPPLPPRKETVSDPLVQSSSLRDSGSSQIRCLPPQLPARPQLATRSEIYAMTSEKSEHTDDNTDEELTSYESNDYEHDMELLSKLSIKLPKTLKKMKKMKNGRKSHSSSQWNLAQPFRSLEDVIISGELHLKRKLTWNKRLVAVSAGRLICYKSEKELRPGLVITLAGYDVSCTEREGRHGYELKLTQPMSETYHFAVECKDWAQTWAEVIKCVAEGKPVPNRPQHLTRAISGHSDSGMGSRNDVRGSGSNLSTASSDHGSHDENFHRRTAIEDLGNEKSHHLGMLASKASQFLETIGRKRHLRKPSELKLSRISLNSSPKKKHSTPSSDTSPEIFKSEKLTTLSENNRWQDISIKCKSYLNVYSSFNKRPWGKRWCLVKLHTFECYQNSNSNICELNFLLKDCVVRWAKEETKSELGLMILNNNIEKITVEALNETDMRNWLSVLMEETATKLVPEGLDKYFEEQPYSDIPMSRQSSVKYSQPNESDYESCERNLALDDKVFDENLETVVEELTKLQEEERISTKAKVVLTAQVKRKNVIDSTEKSVAPVDAETSKNNCALIPQNGKSEMSESYDSKLWFAEASGTSADLISKHVQDIQETYLTDSSASEKNTSTPVSSQATPDKSSSTDISENVDPLYSWNPQYRSSELLSEKDIEALMQSWNVKTKIFMLEEKQQTDMHSKQDGNKNSNSRHSVGALSTPNKKPFVSTSRSANFLSKYTLDNVDNVEDAPSLNSTHSPPKNLAPNGFSTGK